MKILAFDTTSGSMSTAILFDKKTVAKIDIFESGLQAEMLIPTIEKCLSEAKIWYQDLDLIALTSGPGSFTGVRIGISCAKALQLATNLPVIGVSSLEAIAFEYKNHDHNKHQYQKLLVINDAKMDEFFIQEFDVTDHSITASYEPQLINSEKIADFFPKEKFLLAGNAKNLLLNIHKENCIISKYADVIDAVNIALLAEEIYLNNQKIVDGKQLLDGCRYDTTEAIYIREPQISISKKKKLF